MNKRFIISALGICSCALLWAETHNIEVQIENPWDKPQADAPVSIMLSEVKAPFAIQSAVVKEGTTEIPSQLDDLNGDEQFDELAFVIDMPANAEKTVTITFSSEKSDKKYPSRVYATLKLRDRKGNKHVPIQSLTVPGSSNVYNMVYPHGPAFESELVAYRVYFNEKQTLDPYGKFHKGLEIEESVFYPNDEQLAKGFGDDVLRVFDSCGPGTLKGWDGEKATHIKPVGSRTESILAYGPVRTIVEIIDKDWEYQGTTLTMTTRYILYAGHRDVETQVSFNRPLREETFCTGVQNIKGSQSYSDHEGLVGCWGTHWPVNDTVKYAKETVGLGAYLPQKYIVSEINDKVNYLYQVHAPKQTVMTYYITFTSMKETFGYKTPEAWFEHLQTWKTALDRPCTIKIKKK